jgi:hypothetical protein
VGGTDYAEDRWCVSTVEQLTDDYNLTMPAEFEPFVQIAGLIHALTNFADNLGQTTQEWMEQLQQGLNERSREFAAALAEHEKEQAEGFRVLAQGGWVGMERHFTFSQARSVLEIYKAKGEAAMNDAIANYFNANACIRISEITDGRAFLTCGIAKRLSGTLYQRIAKVVSPCPYRHCSRWWRVCRSRSWEMQCVMKMPSKRSPETGSSESRKCGRKYLRTSSSTWSTNAMIFALTQPHI